MKRRAYEAALIEVAIGSRKPALKRNLPLATGTLRG